MTSRHEFCDPRVRMKTLISDGSDCWLKPHRTILAAPHPKRLRYEAVLQRDITKTDNQIDQLVYELYGLTDEEIAIVEEATKA